MNIVNYNLQQSIIGYLSGQNTASGSLLSGSNIVYHGGESYDDIQTFPYCVVNVIDSNEVDLFTRNYDFTVDVTVYESPYDNKTSGSNDPITNISSLVFNEFYNSQTASINFTNSSYGIAIWQVSQPKLEIETSGDALINKLSVTMYGAQT